MEYCHGVGIRLSHLMGREHGTGFDVLQRVKENLDPHNVLNPGKLSLGKQVASALPFNSATASPLQSAPNGSNNRRALHYSSLNLYPRAFCCRPLGCSHPEQCAKETAKKPCYK